jgi:hypothetical protein
LAVWGLARTLELGFISEDAFKRSKTSGLKFNGCSWRQAGYLCKMMLKKFFLWRRKDNEKRIPFLFFGAYFSHPN